MNELLLQGVELMLIGMGVVFTFLIIMVGLTNVMSALVKRFEPAAQPVSAVARRTPAQGSLEASQQVSAQTVRVIEDAIRQHRQRQSS